MDWFEAFVKYSPELPIQAETCLLRVLTHSQKLSDDERIIADIREREERWSWPVGTLLNNMRWLAEHGWIAIQLECPDSLTFQLTIPSYIQQLDTPKGA